MHTLEQCKPVFEPVHLDWDSKAGLKILADTPRKSSIFNLQTTVSKHFYGTVNIFTEGGNMGYTRGRIFRITNLRIKRVSR